VIELYLRLAGATLLLLLPGALVARSASGAVVTSLTLIFGALVVVFATGSSLTLALWLVLGASVAAIPLALRRPSDTVSLGERRAWLAVGRPSDIVLLGERWAWLAVLGGGVVFGLLLWRVLPEPAGDALFHLARVRKLAAFDELSLEGVGEFVDGGLHPGYAFPLWHGFLALIAEIARVDPALVVRHEAAVLLPLSLLVLYEAGVAVFRSAWLGLATVAATLGWLAFAAESGGAFRSLALPATAGGRLLLVPAAFALVFAYLREPTRARLLLVGAAGLVLAVVHPSYAPFTLVLLAGFAVARVLVVPGDLRRIVFALGAFAVASGLFLAWLFPVVRDSASFTPSEEQIRERAHGVLRYPRQFIVESPDRYHVAPALISRAGPVPIAALCLVPLALLAAPRRWTALVLGGTVATLLLLLLDVVFPRLADAVSLSQARRLSGFLPIAFALAGGAAVLARVASWGVLPLALAAGVALEWLWPGDFGYVLKEGGPTLPVWIALLGGAAALALALVARDRLPTLERTDWLPAAACALFVAPLLVMTSWGLPRRPQELSPGLVEALREWASPGDVVLSDPVTSYWLAAQAPVYVAVAEPTHVGDTRDNRPYERVEQWNQFLRTGAFPGRADWIVLDRRRVGRVRCAPRRFEDARYTLCAREP
jgi:hypothetical protein